MKGKTGVTSPEVTETIKDTSHGRLLLGEVKRMTNIDYRLSKQKGRRNRLAAEKKEKERESELYKLGGHLTSQE